jgi:flavin-binding protein dodecin
MAKKSSGGVYRVTEIIGSSKTSWEDAAKNAGQTAAKTLRDMRVAEVNKLDMTVENG